MKSCKKHSGPLPELASTALPPHCLIAKMLAEAAALCPAGPALAFAIGGGPGVERGRLVVTATPVTSRKALLHPRPAPRHTGAHCIRPLANRPDVCHPPPP